MILFFVKKIFWGWLGEEHLYPLEAFEGWNPACAQAASKIPDVKIGSDCTFANCSVFTNESLWEMVFGRDLNMEVRDLKYGGPRP